MTGVQTCALPIWQNDEAANIGTFDNLEVDLSTRSGQAAAKLRPLVAAISIEFQQEWIETEQRLHQQDVLGFGGIRIPNNPVESEIAVSETEKALVNLGLSGITLEPGFALSPTLGPDDPNLYPVYERCQELNAVLALTISVRAGTAMKYSNPEAVDSVARRFPRLKIVIGHSCWPWVAQAIGVAYRNSNVYLHPDFYGLGCAGHQQWVEAANTLLGEQIIFGSAYPLAAVSPMVEGYRRLGFREGVLENVMYRNAARVLGIEP